MRIRTSDTSGRADAPDHTLPDEEDGLAQPAARQLAKRQARKTRHDSRHAVTKGTAAADAHEFPGTRTYRNLDVLRRDLGMATGHEIPDDVQSITRTAIRLTGHAPIIRIDPQGREIIVQQWEPDNK